MADITTSRIVYNNEGPPIQANGFIRIDSSGGTDNYYLEFYEASDQRFRIYENSNNVYFDGGPGSTHFRPRQGGGTGNFLISGSNVGIGTTSPAVNLHIASSTPKLRLQDTDGGYAEINANNTDLVIKTDPDDAVNSSTIQFEIDGSEYMRLQQQGRLGIGVTSPGHILDVSGNIRLQGGDRKIVFNNGSVEVSLDQMNGGVGGLGTLARFGVGTIAPNNTLQVVGNITIGTGTVNEAARTIMTGGTINLQAADANHRIIIRGTQDTSGTITGNTNNMDFYEFGGYNFYSGVNTGTGARTLALAISSGGGSTFAGNVDINGGILNLGVADTSSGNINAFENMTFNIDTDNDDTARYFAFYTNASSGGGTELLKIEESGNVGIGTASPAAKLHVSGDTGGTDSIARFQNTNSAKVTRIQLSDNAGTVGDVLIAYDHSDASSANHFVGMGVNNNTAFKIDNNDIVGMGATGIYAGTNAALNLPSYALAIKNNVSGSNNNWSYIRNTGTGSEANIEFTTGIGIAMTMAHNKNIGIGNTSPNATLEIGTPSGVAGSAGSVNRLFISPFSNTGGPYKFIARTVSGASDFLDMYYGSTHIISYGLNGNVGIGVTSPSDLLSLATSSGDCVIGLTGNSGGDPEIHMDSGNNRSGNIKYGDGSTLAMFRYQHSDVAFKFYAHNQTDVDFQIGENTSFFASCNLGIGTTSPSHKLDVNGDAKFISNSSSRVLTLLQQSNNNGNIIQFQNHNGGNVWEVVGRNNQFYIYNNALTSFALFIDPSNSNIGIGNTSPSQKLHVTGSILASSDVVAFSDKKLKENIKTLDGSKVYDMRGVSFTRKDTGKDSSGVIAQEIQKIAPELVTDNNGTLSVAYGNLTGYLIEAVKELKTEVEQLKKQIKNGNNV